MRKATRLFVLIAFGVLVTLFGTIPAAASPAVAYAVSGEFFEQSGTVSIRIAVTNSDSTNVSAQLSDAHGNVQSIAAIRPGSTATVVFHTTANVVMGYTVQVVVKTADGRVSARGHMFGTHDLREVAPTVSPEPSLVVRVCDIWSFDLARCLAERGLLGS